MSCRCGIRGKSCKEDKNIESSNEDSNREKDK